MKTYYDNGEVLVEAPGGDITLIVIGTMYTETATLSPAQAREVAAALVKAAEDREGMFDENR